MSMYGSFVLAANDVFVLAQGTEGAEGGPMGPEFGKASPIGLLILALMGVAVPVSYTHLTLPTILRV